MVEKNTITDRIWEIIAYVGVVLGILGIILVILKILGLL